MSDFVTDNKTLPTVKEDSFLGNSWIRPHVAGNLGGSYYCYQPAGNSEFVGPYAEGGQGPAPMGASTVIFGGTLADSITSVGGGLATWIQGNPGGLAGAPKLADGGTIASSTNGAAGAARLTITFVTPGTGGTFDVKLYDVQQIRNLLTQTTINANQTQGTVVGYDLTFNFGVGYAPIGDDLQLYIDFTNSSGTLPIIQARIEW